MATAERAVWAAGAMLGRRLCSAAAMSTSGCTVVACGGVARAAPRARAPTFPALARGFAADAAAAASTQGAPTPRPRSAKAHLRLFAQLGKARLSSLVVATAAAGYVAGSPETVDWAGCAIASAGVAACSAAANALNQVWEIRTDALMRRTAARPLPSGRMTRPVALAFAGAAAAAGVGCLAVGANPLAAALGAGNIALYAFVYTPLKQVHPAATWVGAVVGAIPPLIGWAASAGELQPGAAILAAGLYFWQLPHFMALAWLCRADYAAGGHRMLSLADPRGARTAGCALRNCLYLLPLGFVAVALGTTTAPFATEAAVATGAMAAAAAAFRATPGDAGARLLFRASLAHLPVWMGCFLWHRVPNTVELRQTQAPAALAARWRAAAAHRPRAPGPPPGPLPDAFLLPPMLAPLLPRRPAATCPAAVACEERKEG